MNDKTKNIAEIIKLIVNSYKNDKTEILCTKTENIVIEKNIQNIINQIVNTYKNNDSNSLFSNTDEPKEIQFQSIIENIKKSFTADFEKYELSKIEILHQKIENGVATPVLYVCGKGTQEIRYTKYGHGLNPLN
jgi:molecular chaperone GrpE (heat shock protein)